MYVPAHAVADRHPNRGAQGAQSVLPGNTIVAAVVTCTGRIGLFRRSASVQGDQHLWHCISGFLPPAVPPLRQAFTELAEETGLRPADLRVAGHATLDLPGADGVVWRVHAFHFDSRTDHITLNWEHDAACWISGKDLRSMPIVSWLPAVVEAMAPSITSCLLDHVVTRPAGHPQA